MTTPILDIDPKSRRANLKLLKAIHALVLPDYYLEIGVRWGDSLAIPGDHTLALGIDPTPNIRIPLPARTFIIRQTSDHFFSWYKWLQKIYWKKPNLALIDGMHLFEYALRDFINLEAIMANNGHIVLDDTNPMDAKISLRNRKTGLWTGDVWKLLAILRKYRPELKITTFNVAPTGLTIVNNLDPTNSILKEKYESILQEFNNISFDYLSENRNKLLNLVDYSPAQLEHSLSNTTHLRHNQELQGQQHK